MDHFMNRRAEEETYALVFGSQEWLDLDRGIISREQANQLMLENAARANRVFEVQTCIEEWAAMMQTKKDHRADHAQAEKCRLPPVLPDEYGIRYDGRAAPAGVVLTV